MTWLETGSADTALTDKELSKEIESLLDRQGPKKKVLAIPPDITRFHSRAGEITEKLSAARSDPEMGAKATDCPGGVCVRH